MFITLHAIRFKNFLSVGNNFESIRLDRDKFTVIVGKNGAGKSTLIDAITYALFNKPFRKIKLGQLVNVFNKKNCVVECVFSVGGHNYVVRRGQKPKVFEIYKDKVLMPEPPDGRDYQEVLEQDILRQSYKTFCQINVLGKATYVPFMDLDAADRRKIVEDLLDAHIYSVMQQLAKDELKGIVGSISEQQTEIKIVENNIATTKSLLKQYDQDRSQKKNDVEAAIESNNQTLIEIDAANLDLKQQYQQTVADINKLFNGDKEKFEKLKEKVHAEIFSLENNINKCQNMINNIDGLEQCPKCFQKVDDSHRNDIVSDNQKEIAEHKKALESLYTKREKIQQISAEDSRLTVELNSVVSLKKQNDYKKERVQSELVSLQKQLEELNKPVVLPDVTPIEELEAQRVQLVEKYDQLCDSQDKYKQMVKMLGDDGLKSFVIGKYIPTINEMLNKYLDHMDLFVQFELDNQFNETIKSHYRDQFSYNSFSEGQKMRINLAILLAWRSISSSRNSVSTNLLLLDEIFDGSLEGQGVADFMSILQQLNVAQNMFVISHNDRTIDNFENVIRVEMDGNFTRYVTD